jgi:hypothetical protein
MRTASRQAQRYSSRVTRAFPGVQRRRTSSSIDSTWIPIETAPASLSACSAETSLGGSHWTWIGSPGTASSTARTQRARWVAPRSRPLDVPVVITIWRMPSRRAAAAATSASWAGVFTAIVDPASSDASMAQKRHRSASS